MISVTCRYFEEPTGLRHGGDVAVEIVVSDTGCGIPTEKLESIFREFEQVESAPPRTHSPGLGVYFARAANRRRTDAREQVLVWLSSPASWSS